MSTQHTIEPTVLPISEEIEGVPGSYYAQIFHILDEIAEDKVSTEGYHQMRLTIANFLYLIHERLQKNMVRGIDYDRVKSWALENKNFVTYLLRRQWQAFPVEAFEKWISPKIEILECGMYTPSNRFNKNIYH